MAHRRHVHLGKGPLLAAVCLLSTPLVRCTTLDGETGNAVATKAWTEPERIHDRGGFPDVAMDGHGNALVLFGHWLTFGESSTTRSARFSPTVGWTAAEQIDRGVPNLGRAGPRQIAVTPDGDAFAVWHQTGAERERIFANRYVAGNGWAMAEPIDTDEGGNGRDPDVAGDAQGNAVAVWQQSDGARENIWSSRFTRDDGWDDAVTIESHDVGDALGPRVAMDLEGNAIAVWHQLDGSHESIWSSRFAPSSGWSVPEPLEYRDTGDALAPQVAMDADGNAIAVWQQSDGTRFNVWSNRFDAKAGWGDARHLETSHAGDAQNPQVAVNAGGSAVAVWEQFDGRSFGIWCSRYTPARGWEAAQPVETHELGESLDPRVAIDPTGHAIAVWYRNDGTRDNIWANYYVAGHGWGDAERIDHWDEGIIHQPRVAMGPDGNAVAVWLVWTDVGDGIFGLWSRRFEDMSR